jgi:tetratricopeptide (TPR) repeat protein
MEDLNTIRTLWHGSTLSIFEELSLRSFVRCGHEVEVYSYNHLSVPPGVRVCDASTIVPASGVFSYNRGLAKGSFAAFSNLFRFELLYQKGGIWADTDVLCLKSLHELPDACVGKVTEKWLNGAILKFSRGHPVCKELAEKLTGLGTELFLGQTSELITAVASNSLHQCNLLPVSAFYPLHSKETWRLLDPSERQHCEALSKNSYCVHWWNAVLTLGIELPKDALPPKGSFLYSQAERVFAMSELKAWPLEIVEHWIRKQKKSSHAEQASKAKDWPEAVTRWEEVLDDFGDQATADMWVYLAQAHRHSGNLDQAELVVSRGISQYPDNYRLTRERAEIALAKGEWPKAVERWQALLQRFPGRTTPRDVARISRTLRYQGDLVSAEIVASQGISIHGNDLDLANEFAEIATARKDWPEATQRWNVLMNACPEQASARVYLRLSQALRRTGEIDAASSILCKGISAWPDDSKLARELDQLKASSFRKSKYT